MKKETIVRAWKDPAFRASLSPEEREALPDSPLGASLSELDETEMSRIIGGALAVKLDGSDIFANTGCTGARKLTCGIINCTLPKDLETL